RPPWGLLAAWLLPALLLPAAGMHHVEEYVAVAAPALMMIAAIGLLRAAGLMRSMLSLCGLRRDSSVDRLEGAFAVTHLLVIGLLNAQVLFMLFSVDVSNSRVISGRPLKSLQEQLHKEGDPLPREDLA